MSVGNYHNEIVTNHYAYELAQSSLFRVAPFGVTYNPDLPPLARYLHSVIAGIINIDTNSGQMSYEGLALLSGMGYRSVIRYVKVLEKAGLIRVDRAPQGSKIPNIYHLQGKTADMILRVRSRVTESQHPQMPESPMMNNHMPFWHTSEPETGVTAAQEIVSSVSEERDQAPERHTKAADQVTDWQAQKQDSVEMICENDSVVVESENAESPIFKLDGVPDTTMLQWMKQYGVTRIKEVMDALPRQKNVHHAPGWVASALKHEWEFKRTKTQKQTYALNDGRRYVSGEYASFLQY